MSKKKLAFPYQKLILCVLAGIVITAGGICLSAFVMVSQDLSQTLLSPLATICVCVGCCGGAWLLARIRGEGGLFCGALMGAVFAVMLCILAWGNGFRTLESAALLRLLFVLLSGCVGGYVGMLAAEKHPRRH